MGLDTSHDAWHGAYSAFMRWREKICEIAGLPPLMLMEGFFERDSYTDPFKAMIREGLSGTAETCYRCLPIKWSALKPDALHILLYHSDCDGEIAPGDCAKIADRLEELLPAFPVGEGGGHIGNWRDKTELFIKGCRAAAEAGEPLDFH